MNNRGIVLSIICILAVCLPAARVEADASDRLEEELEFAQELRKRGYTALAVDQLRRTRGRDYLPKKARLKASKILAETYQELGDQAEENRNFEEKEDYYEDAIEEYTKYLKMATDEDVSDTERHTLLYEKGQLCASLADDAVGNMKGSTDAEEIQEYRQTAQKWFEVGQEALEEATNFFLDLRSDLDVSGGEVEEKIEQRKVRKKTGQIQMAYGQLLFDYAQLYSDDIAVDAVEEEQGDAGKEEEGLDEQEREELLQRALETFEDVTEEYSIYAVNYKAKRYIGLCHRELGSFEKAVEFLEKALEVEKTPETAWIVRRARLNLAQTYNAWGEEDPVKYEKADIAVSALVNEVYERAEVSGDQALVDLLFAGWLEKGTAQVGEAKLLLEKADEAKGEGKDKLARQRRSEAKDKFKWAVEKAQEVSAQTDSNWSRNAKVLLDRWLEMSEELLGEEIEVSEGISTFMAEGLRYFEDGDYFKAIDRFQKAIEVGNPGVYGATLIPESLYRIGYSYYKLSSSDHTEGKYTYYYEAALCFEEIVKKYPEAEFAADAGFYGTQLFGALFDQTQEKVEKEQLPKSAEINDGRRYYEALSAFSEQFPDDSRAPKTIFQSAEVARALEQYGDASEIYASIKQEHRKYYEAQYRAGLCRYLEALKMFEEAEDDPPLDEISDRIDRAVDRYVDFIDWYDQNKEWLPDEEVPVVNRWVARTKVSFGKLLVHEAWGESKDAEEGAERALEVLDNVEEEHFEDVDDEEFRKEYLPEAFFVTIQSYRRLGQLREAEKFVDDLVERFGEDEISARAARLLGYAYLQRREDLEDEDASESRIELAVQSGGDYLRKALELKPDQTLDFYNGTALALIDMDEYGEAVKILEAGLDRFPIPEDERPSEAQMAALEGMKDAYREQEKWPMVVQTVKRLLDIEERLNVKRREEGKPPFKNVDYLMDYGLALEKQEKWKEAIEYWREAKSMADNMEEGEETNEAQLKSTVHLAQCYAEQGGDDSRAHGLKVMGWYLLSNDNWLHNKDWAEQVENVFVEYFSDNMSDLADYTYQLIDADINLLRQKPSKDIIVSLTEEHWPEREEKLEELLEEADVGLDTGE